MYQCSSSYPDPFLHSPSTPSPPNPNPNPVPPPPHHPDQTYSHHLYPPSPPHGEASPPSEIGGFFSPAAASSYLQSNSSGSSSALSLHGHLLDSNVHHCTSMNSPNLYDQADFFDFSSAMQGMSCLQPLTGAENCTQDLGGGGEASVAMASGKVERYSAEERKERIERYRSKRNHRNFQKKITYACRKTLADSRPRVRGRFARNGEGEADADGGEVGNCHNSSLQGGAECFGWRTAVEEEDEYGCDPDFWANFLRGLSMSNPISR